MADLTAAGTRREFGGVCRAREPVPSRSDSRGDSVAQLGASRAHSDAGPGSAFCLFKAGKHLPRLPPARPLPRPLPAVTSRPCPPEPPRGPGDKSRSAALRAQRLQFTGQAGRPGLDRGTPGWTGQSRREGTDLAGGNEDSRDWKGLPEVRSGTKRWAKVFKKENRGAKGGEGRLKEKRLLRRVGT